MKIIKLIAAIAVAAVTMSTVVYGDTADKSSTQLESATSELTEEASEEELESINLFNYFKAPAASGLSGNASVPKEIEASSDCPIEGIVFYTKTSTGLSNGDTVKYRIKTADGTAVGEYLAEHGYKLAKKTKKVTISGLSYISDSDKAIIDANVLSYVKEYQIDYSSTERLISVDSDESILVGEGDSRKLFLVYKVTVEEHVGTWPFYFYFSCNIDANNNVTSTMACLSNNNSYVGTSDYTVPWAYSWGNGPTVAYNGSSSNGGTYMQGYNHYYVGFYTLSELENYVKNAYPYSDIHVEPLSSGVTEDQSTTTTTSDSSSSAGTIEMALQGNWELSGSGTFTFSNGTLVITSQGQVMNCTYTIDTSINAIKATYEATDGDVTFNIPYKYESGTLHIYNNSNEELTKQ